MDFHIYLVPVGAMLPELLSPRVVPGDTLVEKFRNWRDARSIFEVRAQDLRLLVENSSSLGIKVTAVLDAPGGAYNSIWMSYSGLIPAVTTATIDAADEEIAPSLDRRPANSEEPLR